MLEAWMQMAGSHDPELRLARTSGRRRAMSGARCRELRRASSAPQQSVGGDAVSHPSGVRVKPLSQCWPVCGAAGDCTSSCGAAGDCTSRRLRGLHLQLQSPHLQVHLQVQSPRPASQVRGASPSAARRSGLRRGCRRVASRGDRGGLRWSDPQQRLRSHAGRPGCGRLLDSLPDHVIRLGVEPARSSTPREVARWWTASASDQSNRHASPTLPPL
jgi:hypothetical protein